MDGDRIDMVLKNQAYIIKMLESIVETMPSAGVKPPDIKAVLKPMLDNPVIKNNPALVGMIGALMNEMGGR